MKKGFLFIRNKKAQAEEASPLMYIILGIIALLIIAGAITFIITRLLPAK